MRGLVGVRVKGKQKGFCVMFQGSRNGITFGL